MSPRTIRGILALPVILPLVALIRLGELAERGYDRILSIVINQRDPWL